MQAVPSVHPPGHIGVISGDLARYTHFYVSLMNLRVPSGSTWNWVRGNGIALNRNMILKNLHGSAWVWFIDDDHTFEPDVLIRLLDRNEPIVQGLCCTRKPPYLPYAYHYNSEQKAYQSAGWNEIPLVGLSRWDAVGSGGCLIRRQVIDRMEPPWFEEGHLQKDALGEDLTFMQKARALGYNPCVDSEARMGHCAVIDVWPAPTADQTWAADLQLLDGIRVRVRPEIGNVPDLTYTGSQETT